MPSLAGRTCDSLNSKERDFDRTLRRERERRRKEIDQGCKWLTDIQATKRREREGLERQSSLMSLKDFSSTHGWLERREMGDEEEEKLRLVEEGKKLSHDIKHNKKKKKMRSRRKAMLVDGRGGVVEWRRGVREDGQQMIVEIYDSDSSSSSTLVITPFKLLSHTLSPIPTKGNEEDVWVWIEEELVPLVRWNEGAFLLSFSKRETNIISRPSTTPSSLLNPDGTISRKSLHSFFANTASSSSRPSSAVSYPLLETWS